MDAVEWNKKEELVADQALKHLRAYAPLFKANTTSDRAELTLLVKVQEFCYDNMNFMKVFQKIVILFYKCEYFKIYICIIFTNMLHHQVFTWIVRLLVFHFWIDIVLADGGHYATANTLSRHPNFFWATEYSISHGYWLAYSD